MGLGEKDHKGKVSFSSHHVKGTYDQCDLSRLTLTLITWLRQCACRAFPLQNDVFSAPYGPLWGEVMSSHVRGGELCSIPCEGTIYIIHFKFFRRGDLSLLQSLIYPSIQSFLSMDIYFTLWIIIQYYLLFYC